MSTPPPASTPPPGAPAAPADDPRNPGVAGTAAPFELPPIDDEYVRTREHELSRREHLLVTALLPCSLLLYGTNSVMVWLLPQKEYGFWGMESIVCYGLATFLLAVWGYVKWRYVWSVRRAHHLSFYLKRVVEVVAALALVVMGSYLFGFQYYWKADLTSDRRLSLSPKSQEMLKQLPDGALVEIYLPYTESDTSHLSEADKLNLVRERRSIGRVCKDIEEAAPKYTKATIKFTAINVNVDPNKAAELAGKLGAPPGPTGQPVLPAAAAENLFVLYTPPPMPGAGPQPPPAWNFIAKNRMYQQEMPDKKGHAGGLAFVGESRVISTIDGLRVDRRAVVYYIDNHSRGTSPIPEKTNPANTILNTNNLTGLPLNLLTAAEVPPNARFVLLWNIQSPLTADECDKLYRYLINGGSMLICIDPQGETGTTAGLAPLLDRFGLTVHQERLLQTSANRNSLAPMTLGIVESSYLEATLPPNFLWLKQLASSFQGGSNPVYMRGTCYIDAPRAISDPKLVEQHAKFYETLMSDSPPGPDGVSEIHATAMRPGEQTGPPGPFIIGGVVQMSQAFPAGREPMDPTTGQKVLARDHHLFIVTDSDWIFGNDNMGHHTNQMYLDSMLQKMTGSDRVWTTNDPATNYLDRDAHSLALSFLSGILPALILAIVGYLYLSARRQVPTEATAVPTRR